VARRQSSASFRGIEDPLGEFEQGLPSQLSACLSEVGEDIIEDGLNREYRQIAQELPSATGPWHVTAVLREEPEPARAAAPEDPYVRPTSATPLPEHVSRPPGLDRRPNVRLARLSAGCSQRDFAAQVGTHRPLLSDWGPA
jgi:hypothetical protein